MKIYKKELGKLGENIACGYLKKHGYKIKERNVVLNSGEIDIVCTRHDALVIVEVRSKKKGMFYFPEETVGFRKLRRLIDLMDEYCSKIEFTGMCRIDVIGVSFSKDSKDAELRHYKGVT